MRKAILLLCALCSLSPVFAQQDADRTIFKAMRDEMKRNREQLALPGMQKPFFMSYAFGHYRQFEVVGILGSIVNSYEMPAASVGAVQLLLGDYAHTSDGTYAAPMTQCPMPAEIDYDAIRRNFWLASDGMYKYALQSQASKEAALKNNPLSPEEAALPDLEQVSAVSKSIESAEPYTIDRPALEQMVADVSAVFKNYKDIESSIVVLSGFDTDIYKHTSAGVETKQPLSFVSLSARAQVMTDDGVIIGDVFSVQAARPEDLPSAEELKKQVAAFADNLLALRVAPSVEDYYSGPVLFEDGACSSMFIANLLHKGGLIAFRKAVGGRGNYGLAERMGGKIMDKRLTVKNHTALKEYNGITLAGNYEIDAEGVVPAPEMTLVENGILKGLLNGCIPAPKAPHSTGSSRYVLAPSNLAYTTAPATIHISVSEGLKQEKMKKELLKAAKEEGLEYAYIVRKVAGSASLVYRVDVKDGKETLVRNAALSGIGLTEMERMWEISSEEMVFNYVWNNQVLSSMICPRSVLLEDVKITKAAVKPEKAPILPSPLKRE